MDLSSEKDSLPDIAREQGEFSPLTPLSWVGMKRIEVPVLLPENHANYLVSAHVDALVSLDRNPSRGIHMSRLYLIVQRQLASQVVSFSRLQLALKEFLSSHQQLSEKAQLAIEFLWPLSRKALKSNNWGWRYYPVKLSAIQSQAGSLQLFFEFKVTYSSTCPASAALSRQLQMETFQNTFSENNPSKADIADWLIKPEGMPATPHAQRSEARLKLELRPEALQLQSLSHWIDRVEEALGTPVQAAVKREDEQAFARQNGQNLMFCEDAARKMQSILDLESDVLAYEGSFEHFESLHPHNAVSFISKSKRNENHS